MTKPAATRGRPAHKPSERNRNRVVMLTALGWSARRIANGVGLDVKTLRRRYSCELEARDGARDRMNAEIAMTLWTQFKEGNTGAGKVFLALVEKNDLMVHGQPVTPSAALGKKAAALLDAQNPDINSPFGRILARRKARANDLLPGSAPSADDEVDAWVAGEPH